MIEMLGVLAIIGVLSVGGIMGYSKAMMRYKINKTIDQITYMATNVRTAFIKQKDYHGLVPWAPFLKKMHTYVREIASYVKLNLRILLTGRPKKL